MTDTFCIAQKIIIDGDKIISKKNICIEINDDTLPGICQFVVDYLNFELARRNELKIIVKKSEIDDLRKEFFNEELDD